MLARIGLVWVFGCLYSVMKNVLWVYHRACGVSVDDAKPTAFTVSGHGSLTHEKINHHLITRKVKVVSTCAGKTSLRPGSLNLY